MLHVNTKTNTHHQSTIHVICCIMFVYMNNVYVYVNNVKLLDKIERYKNRLVVVHI